MLPLGGLGIIVGMRSRRRLGRLRGEVLHALAASDVKTIDVLAERHAELFELDPFLRHNAATARWQSGERADAIREFCAIKDEWPAFHYSWSLLGKALLAEGRNAEAAQIAAEGARRFPDQPECHLVLGLSLLRTERLEEAGYELARSVVAHPQDGRLSALQAMLAMREGDLVLAEDLTQRARDLSLIDPVPMLAQALLDIELGRGDPSSLLERARRIDRSRPVSCLGSDLDRADESIASSLPSPTGPETT